MASETQDVTSLSWSSGIDLRGASQRLLRHARLAFGQAPLRGGALLGADGARPILLSASAWQQHDQQPLGCGALVCPGGQGPVSGRGPVGTGRGAGHTGLLEPRRVYGA